MKKTFKRMAIVALIFGILAAIATAVAGGASAKTHRSTQDGCINYAEFVGPTPDQLNKGAVEAFYGVQGVGVRKSNQNNGDNIIVQYPSCGKPADVQFYQISYSRNKAGIYKAGYLTQWNGFDGRTRAV